MSPLPKWPRRSSQDKPRPVDPPKPQSRRGSISGQRPRLLVRSNSGGGGAGQWRDADEGRRSRNRSNSIPPDNRHHHDRRLQGRDGQTGLTPVSANESWAWGQNWADVWWTPGRSQVQLQAQVQVRGQWVVNGGHTEGRSGHREGTDRRGRRSSDPKRSTPTPVPTLRRVVSSTAEPPVIPGVVTPTTNRGMGLRNLLRRNSRKRPKILFYNKDEPHYGFTNFSPHSVVYQGKRYPTSEHLFQSFKVGGVVLLSLCVFSEL